MADKDGLKIAKDYHVNEAFANQGGFYVKGANNLDWGMKKHLSNIFDPKSGNTVMFAFDHDALCGLPDGHPRRAAHLRPPGKPQGHCPARLLRLQHAQ